MEHQTELLQLDQSDIIYFKMNKNLGIEKKILAQIKSFPTNYFSSKQYLLVDSNGRIPRHLGGPAK